MLNELFCVGLNGLEGGGGVVHVQTDQVCCHSHPNLALCRELQYRSKVSYHPLARRDSRLAIRDSRLAIRESRLAIRDSRLERRDTRLARG